jgi:hypothetical protein
LSGKHPALTIYMRDQLPAHLHHGHNERIAPIIGMSEEGWSVSSHERFNRAQAASDRQRGDHGYDPQLRSMHGLFVAAGPQLRRGIIVPRVGAIDTYEFLCRILNITPAPNDGDPSASQAWFID